MTNHPKRLIEVDLPIARISAHARREKSIRHGHISTLHIWWARRPLAACRAVICAALWPDPGDELCPLAFREAAVRIITGFAKRVWPEGINVEARQLQESASAESSARWEALAAGTLTLDANEEAVSADRQADWFMLRLCLLDFIADFANWDNSTVPAYLETARRLTGVAHAALSDAKYALPPSSSLSPSEGERARVRGSNDERLSLAPSPQPSPPMRGRGSSENEGSDWLAALDAQLATLPRPLVVDPFCGGGSIPLEALRVGADAFASDLNPVPVLLNKVVLEYIPKYGQRLAEEVRKWGAWIKREAEQELAEFYPKDPDGATPIAYLWARTIRCEGPACGAEVPLIRSLWLAKKANLPAGRHGRSVALRLIPNPQEKRVDFDILVKQRDGWVSQSDLKTEISNLKSQIMNPSFDGTVKRGSATCPCCGYTTPVARVRIQFKARRGGANDAQLVAVVTTHETEPGRFYRVPTSDDGEAVRLAAAALQQRQSEHVGSLPLVPDEPTSQGGGTGAGRAFSQRHYGMDAFADLFATRQLLTLTTLVKLVHKAGEIVRFENNDASYGDALQACLACGVDRQAEHATSLCRWNASGQKMQATFGRQAIPMMWDFCEANPFGDSVGSWSSIMECVLIPFETAQHILPNGQTGIASAANHPLPNDIASAFITDPPYYDAIPYADLSDFFYVWLRRTLPMSLSASFAPALTPKDDECIVDEVKGKDRAYFERTMTQAMSEGRRLLTPNGIGIVVFANKSTAGWETQLQAMIDAGWTMTGSWPIDTEMGTRLRAMDSAALASSVHLVCRPREDASGAVTESVGLPDRQTGEWRDVLGELPNRIHEWMPRLAAEGVVGADAIFACLGPALEIFSRYRRVEKANGETATLREYLEFVWAAVSTEALALIFQDGSPAGGQADAAGLEPDARLTAMWLWTCLPAGKALGGGNGEGAGNARPSPQPSPQGGEGAGEEEDDAEDDEAPAKSGKLTGGFMLEYDAARKIAQGLGVHLEQCQSLVEVKGDKARLLPVAERTQYLFGKNDNSSLNERSQGARKKAKQKSLFEELGDAEATESGWEDSPAGGRGLKGPPPGNTVLDRVHQTMILFAANRGELLKRFLVEDGIGKDARFWKLADNLNKLYPSGTEERRWIEGVLARKKGLGL